MSVPSTKYPKGSKTIRIPCSEENHLTMVKNSSQFRSFLTNVIEKHPELFPKDITSGYHLHGFTAPSVKLDGIIFFRIKILASGDVYTVAPSYVMPYMCAKTKDVEDAFFC